MKIYTVILTVILSCSNFIPLKTSHLHASDDEHKTVTLNRKNIGDFEQLPPELMQKILHYHGVSKALASVCKSFAELMIDPSFHRKTVLKKKRVFKEYISNKTLYKPSSVSIGPTLSTNDIIKLIKANPRLSDLEAKLTNTSHASGLKKAPNLCTLRLNLNGQKVDLEELSSLQSLCALNLSGSKIIKNPIILSQFINLRSLNLARLKFGEISVLASLTNLTNLDISHHEDIHDISPLESLQNLVNLNLSMTKVKDINTLKSLSKLTKLNLSMTKVHDICALKNAFELRELDLFETQVQNITPLEKALNIVDLDLGKTEVSDIQSLKQLRKLNRVILCWTKVKDIEVLENAYQLRILDLSNTLVQDVRPLAKALDILVLDLGDTPVKDIKDLIHLKQLKTIYLLHTNVSEKDVEDFRKSYEKTNINIVYKY